MQTSTGTDPTPTLASAPDGLSARRVERWLDLPAGAWQRRRLYALRLRTESFAWLGLRKDDLVIVEPGAREQPGSIVVVRSRMGASSLHRIASPVPLERRMPTVLELPLRERSNGDRVVGTVIGVLRSTGTGALRPVPAGGNRPLARRTHRSTRKPDARTGAVTSGRANGIESRRMVAAISDDYLADVQTTWRAWVAARRGETTTEGQVERWERLEASLATLCDCLRRTHSPSLRTALAAEASAIVTTIHSEMGG